MTTVVERFVERPLVNSFSGIFQGADIGIEILSNSSKEETWLCRIASDLVSGNPPLPWDDVLTLSDGSENPRA